MRAKGARSIGKSVVWALTERYNVPVGRGKQRKSISLPIELIERMRRLRFELQLDEEAHCYELVLRKGIEALEREKRERESKR